MEVWIHPWGMDPSHHGLQGRVWIHHMVCRGGMERGGVVVERGGVVVERGWVVECEVAVRRPTSEEVRSKKFSLAEDLVENANWFPERLCSERFW